MIAPMIHTINLVIRRYQVSEREREREREKRERARKRIRVKQSEVSTPTSQ
jgi:hypothetical protein